MTAKRVLFVTRAMPWPLVSGARLRDFNMLRALADDFDIDLLTIGQNASEVSDLCRHVHIATPYYGDETIALAARRWAAAVIETATGPEPLWLTSKMNGTFRRKLRDLAQSGHYDVILASELSSAAALLDYSPTPVIYDAHNCEWRLLDKTRQKQRGLKRWLLDREVPRLRDVERRAITELAMLFTTSQTDLDELHDLAGADLAPNRIIPSAIDLGRYMDVRGAQATPGTVLVPGKFDWEPNLIGLNWFAQHVVPALRARMGSGGFRIVVAGRMTQKTQAKLEEITEVSAIRNPDDMLDSFAAASAVSVPVLVSSGTRLRIAEALACKRPIVSTTAGAAGLDPGASSPWVLADDAEEHAAALASVLTDTDLSARLVENGWAFVQQFDWTALRPPLRSAIQSVLDNVK